jgi:membrane protease YdiL (CAAX protease family)
MKEERMKTKRNLIIFTVLVLGLSWLGKWLDIQTQSPVGNGPGTLIWIASPLLISFLLSGFAGDGWKDLGIKPNFKGNLLWYLISILVYPIVIILALLIGSLIGGVFFLDFSASQIGLLLRAALIGIAIGFVKNIFEEFSWRGYLAPKIYSLGLNIFVGHILVGLIWGGWHLAYLRFVLSYLPTESLVTLVPRFLLGTIAVSIVYGEIRLRINSVWPAVLMHTVGGVCIGALFQQDFIKLVSGREFLVSPGTEGVLASVLFIVVGIGLHQLRKGMADSR